MRIEELLEKGLDLEVGRVNLYLRESDNGATEAVVQVHLQHVRATPGQFNPNSPAPYLELSFDISYSQIDQYRPGTKFHVAITPAK